MVVAGAAPSYGCAEAVEGGLVSLSLNALNSLGVSRKVAAVESPDKYKAFMKARWGLPE